MSISFFHHGTTFCSTTRATRGQRPSCLRSSFGGDASSSRSPKSSSWDLFSIPQNPPNDMWHKCWPLLTHFPTGVEMQLKKIWYLLFWYRGRQILRADVAAAGISMRSQSIAKLGDSPNCRRVTPGISTIWRCPIQGGTPSYHPFLDWILHEINQPAIGVPPWLWNLHMSNRQN